MQVFICLLITIQNYKIIILFITFYILPLFSILHWSIQWSVGNDFLISSSISQSCIVLLILARKSGHRFSKVDENSFQRKVSQKVLIRSQRKDLWLVNRFCRDLSLSLTTFSETSTSEKDKLMKQSKNIS